MLPEDVELYRPMVRYPPKCLDELAMLRMSQEIRSKPKWYEKIAQPEITAKWKSEAEGQGMRTEAVEFVLEMIKHLASLRFGCIEAGPVEGTWIADNLIDEKLCTRLKTLVAEGLENVPPDKKDYHPGSDKLVLDLVHPSLFCYAADQSILINENTIDEDYLPKVGEPSTKKSRLRKDSIEAEPPSGDYRWLPAEIKVDEQSSVTIDSYINNLHPIKHKELYDVLAEILSKFIPMFSQLLTDVADFKDSLLDADYMWYDENDEFDHEEQGDNDEAYQEWVDNRRILPIPIPKFEPSSPEKIVDLKGEKLQVIFKLANIELTTDQPEYDGGSWHIEGIEEERIVATGIYYYEIENITESKLSFRQSIKDPNYDQDDHRGVREVYGLKNDDPLNQVLGSCIAQQDRCIVFPNIYQHCVAPFELKDKNKPGFRKILVFFLVDPTVTVISTHNVLPQQPDWIDVLPEASPTKRKTMSREKAEDNREKLMFERKYSRDEYQKEFFEREFSLCEH